MAREQAQSLQSNLDRSNWPWGRLSGDLGAAVVSATLVSPAIAVIDRAVAQQASTNRPLLSSLRGHSLSAIRRPAHFVFSRPFGLVWTLYASTYVVANGSETLAKHRDAAAIGTLTFVATTTVNVPLGVWKDIRYAQLFGTAAVARSSSRAVMAAFLARDALTIFGSFTLVPYMSDALPTRLTSDSHARLTLAQLGTPILSQLAASPVHLLGLDLYNRPRSAGIGDRMAHIRKYLLSTTWVRCARVIPAFGVGCVLNGDLRAIFHETFEDAAA